MAISISCSNCGRVVYASEKEAGKTKPCPGCGQSIVVPVDPSLQTEKPTTKDCPQCGTKLRLVRQLHGKNVRCNKCRVVLAVSADPWRLSVVGRPSTISPGGRLEESQNLLPEDASPSSAPITAGQSAPSPRLPPRMPPMPDGHPPADLPSDPLAFLRSESAAASPSPRLPAGMPSVPQSSEESEHPQNPTDLQTKCPSKSRSWYAEIKERLAYSWKDGKLTILAPVAGGIILVLLLSIWLIFGRSSGGHIYPDAVSTQSEKKKEFDESGWQMPPVAKRSPGPSDAAGLAGCGACASCAIIIPVAIIAIIVLHIALLVWVARDAKARGMDGGVWMFVVFFTGLIGLLVFVFSRPQGNLIPCVKCSNKRLQVSAVCPHCGNA